jgi:hypothetical protein
MADSTEDEHMQKSLNDACEANAEMGEYHVGAAKELSDGAENTTTKVATGSGTDATKVAVESITLADLQSLRESLSKISTQFEKFGSMLIPSDVRGVIPSNPTRQQNTAVIRPGQPVVKLENTPVEFQDLLKIDD